jgi:signal transduction histidine kinase
MLSQTRRRLTVLYSIVFLACFWIFSVGLYLLVEGSFEVEVGEKLLQQFPSLAKGPDLTETMADINETALDRLFLVLAVFNILLLFIIPAISWILTGRALEPARKAYDAQRQFVSDAAHELRTPLTIVQGEIEMALRNARSPAEYQDVLKSSGQELGRLSELSERLLFLARHDDGKDQFVFAAVDITDVVSSVLASVSLLIKEKGLKLAFHPPDEIVIVDGDPSMLARLFTNLFDNAIKYTPTGGTITATITLDQKRVLVDIADTGIGIAPDMLGKIFSRFTRADVSRGQSKGYGLGLSICRAIAEQHNGKIVVRSEPGRGSTFTVSLPQSTPV